MVDCPDVVFHVGLPKTGSTFLQESVFPFLDVNLIDSADVLKARLSCDKPNVVSDENLFGDVYGDPSMADNVSVLHRIKRLFPFARIIVVFRDEIGWLRSLYNQYCKNPLRHKDVDDFDGFKGGVVPDGVLCFEEYMRYLSFLFDDVLFLDFDGLKSNPRSFVRDVCVFLGCPLVDVDLGRRNVSLKSRHHVFMRFVVGLMPSMFAGRCVDYLNKFFMFINRG